MDDQKEIINEEEKIESVQEPVVENVVEPVESAPTEIPSVEEPVVENVPVTLEEPVTVEPTAIPEEPVVEEAPVENTEPVKEESAPVQQPVQSGKKKFDFKTALLITFLILLFAMVMFMPQITKFVEGLKKDAGLDPIKQRAKEIEEQQNQANQKSNSSTEKETNLNVLICTSQPTNDASYEMTVEESFEYNDKKLIQTSTKKYIYKFTEQNEVYQALEDDCEQNALKYVENDGYETACTFNDKEVDISETFNLKLFKKIEDKEADVVIEANAKYNAKADDVKKELEAKGYRCS